MREIAKIKYFITKSKFVKKAREIAKIKIVKKSAENYKKSKLQKSAGNCLNQNLYKKCGKLQKSILAKKVGEITKIKNCHKSAGNYNYKNYKKVREIAKIKIFQESAGNYKKCGKLRKSKLQKSAGHFKLRDKKSAENSIFFHDFFSKAIIMKNPPSGVQTNNKVNQS